MLDSRLPRLPPEDHGSLILLVEVGSTLHGTGLPGGEDLDLMGVAIPTEERLLGLTGDFGTWTWRTQPEGMQSGPNDIDVAVYSIQRYLSLALKGNPSVMLPIFADDAHVHFSTALGQELRTHAAQWVRSKEAGARFSGYLNGQRQRFLGEKARHGRVRPELIEQYGYDTKYAMHMVRLAFQGIEFMRTGQLTLPMAGVEAEECRAIRRGEFTRDVILARIDELDTLLKIACDDSALPEHPDREAATQWMIEACKTAWKK